MIKNYLYNKYLSNVQGDAIGSSAQQLGTDTLSFYRSGDVDGYNVTIKFTGNNWTPELQEAFIESSDYLSDIIIEDIPTYNFLGLPFDDVFIFASLGDIDGPGGTLGMAGAFLLRPTSALPAAALMRFDTADANDFYDEGTWGDIVLHEMLHSIGFSSTTWRRLGLIEDEFGDNPIFTGENAKLAYENLFSPEGVFDGVPLEEDGGPGTAYSHWDEETFDNELMTGYINDTNYISDMTIAALEDMGYETVFDASDYIV